MLWLRYPFLSVCLPAGLGQPVDQISSFSRRSDSSSPACPPCFGEQMKYTIHVSAACHKLCFLNIKAFACIITELVDSAAQSALSLVTQGFS